MLPELTADWWRFFYNGYSRDDVYFLPSKQTIRNDTSVLGTDNIIARNKAILAPVEKWISLGFPFSSDQLLRDTAKSRVDSMVRIEMQLDGVLNKAQRIMSPVFNLIINRDIHEPELGPKLIRKGKYKAVSDGWWLYLPPDSLDLGRHQLDTFASCAAGVISLRVKHTLQIV